MVSAQLLSTQEECCKALVNPLESSERDVSPVKVAMPCRASFCVLEALSHCHLFVIFKRLDMCYYTNVANSYAALKGHTAMNDTHLASSYRRIFRIVSKDMPNWKNKIIVCVDSDDMRGATNAERISRAVKRMNYIMRAIRFMVGDQPFNHVKVCHNAVGSGITLVYRNAGYYANIGA